jgi:hypothetical protein
LKIYTLQTSTELTVEAKYEDVELVFEGEVVVFYVKATLNWKLGEHVVVSQIQNEVFLRDSQGLWHWAKQGAPWFVVGDLNQELLERGYGLYLSDKILG